MPIGIKSFMPHVKSNAHRYTVKSFKTQVKSNAAQVKSPLCHMLSQMPTGIKSFTPHIKPNAPQV